MTGMLISGKMSTGVRINTTGNNKMMASAITTKVYGLRSASRTIHIKSYFATLLGGRAIELEMLSLRRQFSLDSREGLFGYGPNPAAIGRRFKSHVLFQSRNIERHSLTPHLSMQTF